MLKEAAGLSSNPLAWKGEGSLVFLLGKEGTGKTALLRWLARELQEEALLVEGEGLSSPHKGILLWDDADRSSLWLDPQRAKDVLAGFSACILTGKTLPPALEMLFSRKGQVVTLDVLSPEDLERFLDQRFPRLRSFDPAFPWYPLTGGRLGWVLLLAHRMERERSLAPDPLLFAVEILLHPASRRYGWRPEVYGHPLDALFFLAVVLPTWDRRDAEEITGLEISTALWETFLALPFVRSRGPRRYLPPEVRRPLLSFLESEKPWLTFAWRQKAFRFWNKAFNHPHLWQGEQDEEESLLANLPAFALQEAIAQVKTFLESCRRGKSHDSHRLAEIFGTIYPHLPRDRAKRWVQNALEDAPSFREKPILKDILWHYYFRPRKSHEELAHRFHLSRATYFRYHRDALERLARVLLPVEDSF